MAIPILAAIQVADAPMATRVVNAFAAQQGYQATLLDGTSNPETKAQFMHRLVIQFIKDTVKTYESNAAAEAARKSAIDQIETGVTLS